MSDPLPIPHSRADLPAGIVVDLDLRGLRCPMPVLRTRKALQALAAGGTLRVSCTDPLAGLDIPHLLRETGDALVASALDGAVQVFTIRKG